MENQTKITDKVTVGCQPKRDEFESLKNQGFQSVINLRVENEDQEMLSPIDEGDLVREQGMTYLHMPVTGLQFRPGQVDDFRQFIDTLDGPIFVHCKKGKRAGAFAMMHRAVKEGWSGEQTLKEAEKTGFECDQESLATFVKEYVDDHTSG